MTTFDTVRPSGVWANEMVPGASDYQRWDLTQSKIVSGAGDARVPSSPIVIGGLGGLQLTSTGTRLVGGVRTQTGGTLVLGSLDVIAVTPRTRTIVYPLMCVQPQQVNLADGFASSVSPSGKPFLATPGSLVESFPPPYPTGLYLSSVKVSGIAGAPIYIPIPGEWLHNASNSLQAIDAQLSSVLV